MNTREQRLQAILELIRAGPDGARSRDDIYRESVGKHRVGLRTARDDLQELEALGAIVWTAGWVSLTAAGKKLARRRTP